MNEPQPKPEPPPKAQGSGAGKSHSQTVGNQPANAPDPPKKLTPEEQMAQFEDDLKENDWGHQPC